MFVLIVSDSVLNLIMADDTKPSAPPGTVYPPLPTVDASQPPPGEKQPLISEGAPPQQVPPPYSGPPPQVN